LAEQTELSTTNWGCTFIAFHGSWYRSVPTGYKVVFVPLNSHGQVRGSAQDFATGWLLKNTSTGRPVGLAVGPDGSLYVSDDEGGFIYRINYRAACAGYFDHPFKKQPFESVWDDHHAFQMPFL
jgi:hypothetical protein